MPRRKPVVAEIVERKKRVAANDTSAKRVARKPKSVQVERCEYCEVDGHATAKCPELHRYENRPDTDDPSQMMAAEAACGPLVDPILEDEDDSDDSPLDGGAP